MSKHIFTTSHHFFPHSVFKYWGLAQLWSNDLNLKQLFIHVLLFMLFMSWFDTSLILAFLPCPFDEVRQVIEQAECVERVADDLCHGPGCDKQQHAILALHLQKHTHTKDDGRMMGGWQSNRQALHHAVVTLL